MRGRAQAPAAARGAWHDGEGRKPVNGPAQPPGGAPREDQLDRSFLGAGGRDHRFRRTAADDLDPTATAGAAKGIHDQPPLILQASLESSGIRGDGQRRRQHEREHHVHAASSLSREPHPLDDRLLGDPGRCGDDKPYVHTHTLCRNGSRGPHDRGAAPEDSITTGTARTTGGATRLLVSWTSPFPHSTTRNARSSCSACTVP